MAYHTALDVSLRSVSICIVDDDGTIQYEGKAASDVSDIVVCLRRFDPSIKSVGFEAGTLTQYLTYGLQAAGYEVICLEARQVSATLAATRNKTDKNDARGIAQIQRTGMRTVVSSADRFSLRVCRHYWSTLWDLNRTIRKRLDAEGIEIPFPQRVVTLRSSEDPPPPKNKVGDKTESD